MMLDLRGWTHEGRWILGQQHEAFFTASGNNPYVPEASNCTLLTSSKFLVIRLFCH